MKGSPQPSPAGFFRRLAAIAYDAFLLTAILLVYSAVLVALNHGEVVRHPLYYISIVIIAGLFFGFFWTRRGQTLGMQSWRIRLIDSEGNIPGWKPSIKRLLFSVISWLPCGLGFVWSLLNKDKRSWHDQFSKTYLVYMPKSKPNTSSVDSTDTING